MGNKDRDSLFREWKDDFGSMQRLQRKEHKSVLEQGIQTEDDNPTMYCKFSLLLDYERIIPRRGDRD